ncbi:MAG TPA: penicillin-binding protein 2 [Candidatus Dojkabacteria bacterium]|nr:penicillin-binding protein 2 [Candidatus Dojkabacteria bacterium]
MASLHTLYSSQGKTHKKGSTKKRLDNIYLMGIGLTVFAFIVLLQIFRWQILEADKFKSLANEQYKTNQIQTAQRGTITASDGTVLAVDEPTWNIYATLSTDPVERATFFANKEKFIAVVSTTLGVEREEIESKITDTFVYAPLKKNVSTEKKKALETANIFGDGTEGFGLYFESEERRIYPNGQLAAHVLGFIGQNEEGTQIGQYGLQGYYFGDITGTEGYSYQEKDSSGNVILTSEYEPILPREGKDFKLTIVPNIQNKVEQKLEEGVKKTRSKSGTAILMDPKTGAIMAMANYPSYNPNEYWRVSEPWILKNRAISDVYEYGSVQKPITIAIALESGAIDKDFKCVDKTGSLDLYKATKYPDLKGRFIYTWNKKADGTLDISGILQNSNNPCVAQIALKTNFADFYSKLKDFGIGEFIGVGLQEETTSYLRPYEQWTKLDLITASFGQGISATSLQVISALSTLANDGKRMRPYIISEITDNKETIVIEPKVISEPVSKDTANFVTKALQEAVQKGLLGGLVSPDLKKYDIAAKTGTAQIAKSDSIGYSKYITNATTVGYAPTDSPKLILLVKLEEPEISEFAAYTSNLVWRDIFLAIVNDMEIQKRK